MHIIKEAQRFAKEKHKDQVDKAEQDYYSAHVDIVAKKVEEAGYSVEYIVVAYLHDILEDTNVTIEDIINKFGDGIALAINALTKVKDENYDKYIERVKQNQIATVVKYYDMEHNSDLSRFKQIREEDLKRQDKYLKNMEILYEIMKKNSLDLELKDITAFYHTKMYIQAEYSKLIWKRFNWFLVIESGLVGLFFTKKDMFLKDTFPLMGIIIAILWFIMGVEDQKSVQKHKEKGKFIEKLILYRFPINENKNKDASFKQTNVLWIVPIVIILFWSYLYCFTNFR